jgi:hypothetical protein
MLWLCNIEVLFKYRHKISKWLSTKILIPSNLANPCTISRPGALVQQYFQKMKNTKKTSKLPSNFAA